MTQNSMKTTSTNANSVETTGKKPFVAPRLERQDELPVVTAGTISL